MEVRPREVVSAAVLVAVLVTLLVVVVLASVPR